MLATTIWILTEERPKIETISYILKRVANDAGLVCELGVITIEPHFSDGKFQFLYIVRGFDLGSVVEVKIKIVSGSSSFVDYIVFLQEDEPSESDEPQYLIEETKTDDSESRNTSSYQRLSKFVYVKQFYPNAKCIMLYGASQNKKEGRSATRIFGIRLLKTLGVEIVGKDVDGVEPFSSIDELLSVKANMRKPPAGNVPVTIRVGSGGIILTGRLVKNGGIGHDPNIGALTGIAGVIRCFDSCVPITVELHGVLQHMVQKSNNKFIILANILKMKLDGIELPSVLAHVEYWHYDLSSEKNVSILLDCLSVFANKKILYSNHAGAERSYFTSESGEIFTVPKYQVGKRDAYKLGDRSAIIHIPDLIVLDSDSNVVLNCEAKRNTRLLEGIEDIRNYNYIEKEYILKYNHSIRILRGVILFGGVLPEKNTAIDSRILFWLAADGSIYVNNVLPTFVVDVLNRFGFRI